MKQPKGTKTSKIRAAGNSTGQMTLFLPQMKERVEDL